MKIGYTTLEVTSGFMYLPPAPTAGRGFAPWCHSIQHVHRLALEGVTCLHSTNSMNSRPQRQTIVRAAATSLQLA